MQPRHQNPHAAQLFSLATASFKNLFFPDYASVGCLWRPGWCLLKKERARSCFCYSPEIFIGKMLFNIDIFSQSLGELFDRKGEEEEGGWGPQSDLFPRRIKIKREKPKYMFSFFFFVCDCCRLKFLSCIHVPSSPSISSLLVHITCIFEYKNAREHFL